jgi:hypothetical protein
MSIAQYLGHYAHPRLPHYTELPLPQRYARAICVPAAAEGNRFLPLLSSLARATESLSAPCLLFFLINSSSKDSLILNSNLETFKSLGADPSKDRQILTYSPFLDIFVMDAGSSAEKILRDGVGEARKLLADTALHYFARGAFASPWLRMLDADEEVAPDYLSDEQLDPQTSYTYPFRHVPSGDRLTDESTEIYEIYLHHYSAGLRRAGSPHDFFALGSILLFRFEHYALIRGFPSRNAAEDFYFLAKLTKIAPTRVLEGRSPLQIRSRVSDRVPFGTGAAVGKINEKLSYPYYDEKVFAVLGEKIQGLRRFCASGNWEDFAEVGDAFWGKEKAKMQALWKNFPKSEKRLKALMDYVDAFKTLKYLHWLRDTEYPSRNLSLSEARELYPQRLF